MPEKKVVVEGLRDENDVQKVRHALGEVWGIEEVAVDLRNSEVTFTYDERSGAMHDFVQAIRGSGFTLRGDHPTPWQE